MRHWRAIDVAAGVGLLVAPLAALAQPETGAVTTSPLPQQAPALGMPLLAILAVALTAITVYRLRRAAAGRIVGLGLVAAMTVLAGIGYAVMQTITITGADCAKQTVSPFFPLEGETLLTSECPNLIRIVDIQDSCDGSVVSPNAETGMGSAANDVAECSIGQILANGNTCALPGCL
jgi:hypothetical protein